MAVSSSGKHYKVTEKTKTISYKGNTIVFKTYPGDSTEVINPLTGEEALVVTRMMDSAITLNGTPIISFRKSNDARLESYNQKLSKKINKKITKDAKVLGAGSYNYSLDNIILNTDGTPVFVQAGSISRIPVIGLDGKPLRPQTIDKKTEEALLNTIKEIVTSTKLPSYTIDGDKKIICFSLSSTFEIQ